MEVTLVSQLLSLVLQQYLAQMSLELNVMPIKDWPVLCLMMFQLQLSLYPFLVLLYLPLLLLPLKEKFNLISGSKLPLVPKSLEDNIELMSVPTTWQL